MLLNGGWDQFAPRFLKSDSSWRLAIARCACRAQLQRVLLLLTDHLSMPWSLAMHLTDIPVPPSE